MNLVTEPIEEQIQSTILDSFRHGQADTALASIPTVLDAMYAAIPEKKRISHGRFTTIKVLAEYLYGKFEAAGISSLESGALITSQSSDFRAIGVGLGILSLYGLVDFDRATHVIPYFEAAASAGNWEPREHAQGLFRKIVKQHPDEIRPYLLGWVQSDDPNLRRFVSEMLRPVVESQWLYNDIDYSVSILRYLFKESHPYPRTSVGNNLSDIARRKPEVVYDLIVELVAMKDKNATWIATRACRNLVKKEPIRVMDLLGVDEYKYKTRMHYRKEYD